MGLIVLAFIVVWSISVPLLMYYVRKDVGRSTLAEMASAYLSSLILIAILLAIAIGGRMMVSSIGIFGRTKPAK